MITCAKIYIPAIADKVILVGPALFICKSSQIKLFICYHTIVRSKALISYKQPISLAFCTVRFSIVFILGVGEFVSLPNSLTATIIESISIGFLASIS